MQQASEERFLSEHNVFVSTEVEERLAVAERRGLTAYRAALSHAHREWSSMSDVSQARCGRHRQI